MVVLMDYLDIRIGHYLHVILNYLLEVILYYSHFSFADINPVQRQPNPILDLT